MTYVKNALKSDKDSGENHQRDHSSRTFKQENQLCPKHSATDPYGRRNLFNPRTPGCNRAYEQVHTENKSLRLSLESESANNCSLGDRLGNGGSTYVASALRCNK